MKNDTRSTLAIYRSTLEDEIRSYGGATILDHASRTSEELDSDVVALALALGWSPVDALELGDDADGIVPSNVDEDDWTESRAERIGWAAEDALAWLGDHAAPEGTWIGHDGYAGALVCQPVEDDEEIVPPAWTHRWDYGTSGNAQVRRCEDCGAREAYWSDEEYGHEACPESAASAECRHCGRTIVTSEGAWIDHAATGDDTVWSKSCDAHDTFTAEHEPCA